MISKEYKNIYDAFIKKYKEIHVNPWHEISEEELNVLANNLISQMEIKDIYDFKYFIDYIIKRLSGSEDAHTKALIEYPMPINFKIINNKVFINYPNELKGSILLSINGIDINTIINEIDEVITYGTPEKRRYEIEKALFNSIKMFGLPSLKESNTLKYKILTTKGEEIIKEFKKDEEYTKEEQFDYSEYLYGDNTSFLIEGATLIYKHTSVQPQFKELIENSINNLKQLDLTNVKRIIIDIRGNTGGNSALNKILIDFLKEHQDKELITLVDYRVFSGGRFALRDLINLGSITIGEEISTPINCYGNSHLIKIGNKNFSISEHFYHPILNVSIKSKEEYKSKITPDLLKAYIFKPDIYIEQTEEDFINGIDTILEYVYNELTPKRKRK